VEEQSNQTNAVQLATELTVAWLSNPNTRTQPSEVPDFLRTMHEAVTGLTTIRPVAEDPTDAETTFEPAVSVRKSLASRDRIISLIDGKPYKTLKRHLANNGLTPAQYRERYGLKSDYPMVAPAYAEQRRDLAKAIGLGRKRSETTDSAVERDQDAGAAEPKRRGRRPVKQA
jgi:predicted transcriptional regulator